MSWATKLESTRVLRSLREALKTLRPVLVIAAVTQAFNLSVVVKDGFFAQIYHLRWPRFLPVLLSNLTTVLWGSLALMVAGLMVAELGHRYLALAVIGVLSFMALATADPTRTLSWPHLGPSALLLAVVVAPPVAWLFDHAKNDHWAATWLIGLVLFGLVVGAGSRLLANHLSWSWLTLPDLLVLPANLALTWLGLPPLLAPLTNFAMSPEAAANLNAALAHPSLSTIPYRFTTGTIFAPFANTGGTGSMLALVLALALVNRRVAVPELVTATVNLPLLTLLSTPVILDLRMLIPFFLAPLASSGIAALALWLRLMPPVVYPVPPSTPGPLFAFLGTNGKWSALVVSLLCLAASVAIYYPFVQGLTQEAKADAKMVR